MTLKTKFLGTVDVGSQNSKVAVCARIKCSSSANSLKFAAVFVLNPRNYFANFVCYLGAFGSSCGFDCLVKALDKAGISLFIVRVTITEKRARHTASVRRSTTKMISKHRQPESLSVITKMQNEKLCTKL